MQETMLKLSSVVSDLFGSSGRRILKAIADGEDDPVALARLGDGRLKAGEERTAESAYGSCTRDTPPHIRALSQAGRTDRRTGSHFGARDQPRHAGTPIGCRASRRYS